MNAYDHRQAGLGLVLLLVGAALGATGLAFATARSAPVAAWICGGGALVLLAAAWLFRCLRVRVAGDGVHVSFGSGWPQKSIPLAEIESAASVRNRWWYGWGIRLTPYGWLWNVGGLDAVEIRSAGGRRFRIGTDDPEGLAVAIEAVRGGARQA